MMKHNLMAAALCAALCVSNAAYAADANVDDGGRGVLVSEKISPNATASLIVVKAGQSINNNEMIYAAEEEKADDNGVVVWSFSMPDTDKNGSSTGGEYDLYIKEDGKEIKKDELVYATVTERSNAKSALALVTNAAELQSVLDNPANTYALKVFGFAMDEYSASGNKAAVAELTSSSIENFAAADMSEAAKEMNLSLAAKGMNGKTAEERLLVGNPAFEGVAYKDIADADLKAWLNTQTESEYSSTAALINDYKEANILYVLNNARVQAIEEKLSEYADDLGISASTEYLRYCSLTDKNNANVTIVNALAAQPANSTTGLLTIIGAATGTQQTGGTGGTGGGHSGGSSFGGSSLGGVAAAPSVTAKNFTDMAQAEWAADAVAEMAAVGIVSGDENGRFRPNDAMTREEFVTMLVLAANAYNENAECSFADTKAGQWHYKYIASAYNDGLVYGINDEQFGVGTLLTRQDMATICKRTADKYGSLDKIRDAVEFADDGEIAGYAKDAVYALFEAGAINGMGENSFSPLGTATRAQGAMIIYNLFLK